MTVEQVIQKSSVEGVVIKIPTVQLDRDVYMGVKKRLEGIGGKWNGGKVWGFVFPTDPTDRLQEIQGGKKVNLKKDFQFFETPKALAVSLVDLAELPKFALCEILEPSAGQGAIIKAIQLRYKKSDIHAIELMPENRRVLDMMKGVKLNDEPDFMKVVIPQRFDRIIANPPFSKNQDIDHVKKMYKLLRKGGRLVSVMSNHWNVSSNKKETEFKEWLDKVESEVYDIPSGTFKKSGTLVGGKIVVINK